MGTLGRQKPFEKFSCLFICGRFRPLFRHLSLSFLLFPSIFMPHTKAYIFYIVMQTLKFMIWNKISILLCVEWMNAEKMSKNFLRGNCWIFLSLVRERVFFLYVFEPYFFMNFIFSFLLLYFIFNSSPIKANHFNLTLIFLFTLSSTHLTNFSIAWWFHRPILSSKNEQHSLIPLEIISDFIATKTTLPYTLCCKLPLDSNEIVQVRVVFWEINFICGIVYLSWNEKRESLICV